MIFFSMLSGVLFVLLVLTLWHQQIPRNVEDVFPEPPDEEDELELEEADFEGDN